MCFLLTLFSAWPTLVQRWLGSALPEHDEGAQYQQRNTASAAFGLQAGSQMAEQQWYEATYIERGKQVFGCFLRPFKWKPDWSWEALRSWKYLWTKPKQLWDLWGVFSEPAPSPALIQHYIPLCYVLTAQNKFKFIIHWIKTNKTQKISEPDNFIEFIGCKHNWQTACCTIVFGSS